MTIDGPWDAAVVALFALIGLLAVVDLIGDVGQGTGFRHVLAEGFVALFAFGGAAALAWRLLGVARATRREAEELGRRLEESRELAVQWREEAQNLLRGLGAEIDRQFDRWRLTVAEKEVALLLLKGLSHKEVAEVRGVSEATTRQQARGIYRKAGVGSRRDLAAFFLEDLALPPSSRRTDPGA